MMTNFLQTWRTERSLFLLGATLLVVYLFTMDTIMYFTLQNSKLVDQKPASSYSPFYPLSIKLLLTSPFNQYVISLSTEYFDWYTQCSKIFYFITPNMISAVHLALGFVSAKLVASECLRTRRIGVLIFELRLWLDVYDGVVYRSHKGILGYSSDRNNFGFVVDTVCDITSGMALCYGILFYLWKAQVQKPQTILPHFQSVETGKAPFARNGEKPPQVSYTRNTIFFKTLCFGLAMALSGMSFDKTSEALSDVFCKKLPTTLEEDVQTEALHSLSTWFVFYIWRLTEAQALLQYVLLAILLDKLWEFICFVQFTALGVIIMSNIVSQLQIAHVRQLLNAAENI